MTDECYEHRLGWLEEKLLALPQTFAIEIAAYAIMSNHYHVVLYIDKQQADDWSDIEVVERWHSLFKENLISQKFLKGEVLGHSECKRMHMIIAKWTHACTISVGLCVVL